MSIMHELKRARAEAERSKMAFLAQEAKYEATHKALVEAANAWLVCCRRATPNDYASWLSVYLSQGGRLGHAYDYEMPKDMAVVVTSECTITPLYGASAYMILDPDNLSRSMALIGHNKVFSIQNGIATCNASPPIYLDVEEILELVEKGVDTNN